MNIENHWLQQARKQPSPNFDARPTGIEVDCIVIHNISLPPNEFGGRHIDELFTNCLDPAVHPYFADICHLEVSAHVLIDRYGSVTQYVGFDQRAWHAGQSEYQGRQRFNDFSIGIELEGADEVPYEAVQYLVLARLIVALGRAYPALLLDGVVDDSKLVGHSTISPGRKTDPGPSFDWATLAELARYVQNLTD